MGPRPLVDAGGAGTRTFGTAVGAASLWHEPPMTYRRTHKLSVDYRTSIVAFCDVEVLGRLPPLSGVAGGRPPAFSDSSYCFYMTMLAWKFVQEPKTSTTVEST
mmetsp:Transcript_23539/g.26220  ORF Transcript_23539/g.26220 Transcript_23539/m.26220 type:complete len:104 (-) Transcript_23539:60-371(-)